VPTLDPSQTPVEPSGQRYQPIAQIGRGGMAEVLLAMMDAGCGARRLVVLKRIWPELATDPEFMTMFMDEARLSVRLNHPNVVRTFEVLSTQTEVSIAMEYLDGQPLIRVLNRLRGSGELSVPLRLRIVMSVLAGLEHAHTLTDLDGAPLEVVHRDVSPQNVFVTYDGQVKLVDFGVAKTLAASHHTRPGALKGKLAYMAPEQLQPVPTDRRADLFAVGILLWEMLSGKRMWQGMNEVQIVSQLAAGLPFPALPSDIGLPAGLDAICERALQPNPDHRYRTAAEMEMDLDRVSIGAADSHARNLGRVVSLAFAGERAERQALIESSRHGVVTGELPQAPHARDVERPATPPRAMPSIDVTVSDLGLERPAAGDPSPVLAPPSARGRRVWLRRTAAFAGVLVIGVVLVRVDGGAKRLLVEAQPAPVAQPPAPAPASSVPPIPAAAPQPAAVVIADEALARDQPRSRRVHHRPSADEDATLPPTPAIAGVDLDDPPDRSAHRHGSALRP
jgi:hypothetical protein